MQIFKYLIRVRDKYSGLWETINEIDGTISKSYWYGNNGAIESKFWQWINNRLGFYSMVMEERDELTRMRVRDEAEDYWENKVAKMFDSVVINQYIYSTYDKNWHFVDEIWRNGYWV